MGCLVRGTILIGEQTKQQQQPPTRRTMRIPNALAPIVRWLIVGAFLLPGKAVGCSGPGWESTVFFEEQDLTTGIDAPVILDVTIISTAIPSHPGSETGLARVNRTIKGAFDPKFVKLFWVPSTCDNRFFLGQSGIVFGTIHENAEGELELLAKSETLSARSIRRRAKMRK